MGRGLPRKYAKMGFAKGWKEYRKDHPYKKKLFTVKAYKKTYKQADTKSKTTKVRKVAKRKYTRRKRYRRKKPKIPLEVAVALGSIPFTPAFTGANSPMADAQAGYYEGVANQLKNGFLGIAEDGSFDLMRTLNPFDTDRARYVKMLAVAGIISKLRKSVVRIPFDRIPLIGKYIS